MTFLKKTIITLQKQKENNDKITMLTAYDYSTAKIMDSAGIDCVLVGDSLGMVMLGYENTLSVTMEDMIHHTKAVARGTKEALVLVDMPFMSYQQSVYDAIVNAGRLVKEGSAEAVKLEGGAEFCPQIEAIVKSSIPVVGHLGLLPQSLNKLGGYGVQGKGYMDAKKLVDDALAIQKAGVCAIVLECVPELLARLLTRILDVPTIGIGAGPYCDGQVLVYQDMLSIYSNFKPKFVKTYAEIGGDMKAAFSSYIHDVKDVKFPAEEHSFKIDDSVISQLSSQYGLER